MKPSSSGFLSRMRPYFRQVAGELALGSACGFLMNTLVVLPALLLGHAVDEVLRLQPRRKRTGGCCARGGAGRCGDARDGGAAHRQTLVAADCKCTYPRQCARRCLSRRRGVADESYCKRRPLAM